MSTRPREPGPVDLVTGPDVRLLYVVKQVELAIRAELDKITSLAGLTTNKYTAMTVLERHPGLTSAELARNSFVRPQTMAEIILSLEGQGYVRRDRDGNNRHHFRLSLTVEGKRVVSALSGPVDMLERVMLTDLPDSARADFRDHLIACSRALAHQS